MVIKHIIISGGAYKGLYELGALKYLSQKQFYSLENIKSIHGTSIGGLIGALLCMDMDWETLDNYVINRPWHKITNVSPLMLFDILPKKGLLSIDFFTSALEPVLKSRQMEPSITLGELYEKTNIDLYLYTIELNTFMLTALSHKTHFDLPLINAIYMSCCLPYIFQPAWYNDSFYIDGGLLNNYPIERCIENDEIKKNEILGIKFQTTETNYSLKEDANIFEYGYFLYKKMVKTHNTKNDLYHIHKNNIYELIIPCKDIDVNGGYDAVVNSETREKYIEDGVNYAKIFYAYNEKSNLLPSLYDTENNTTNAVTNAAINTNTTNTSTNAATNINN